MEFLGDHVLGLIVSDMLYRAFPNADEGELSKRLAISCARKAAPMWRSRSGLVDDIKLGAVGAGAGARLRKSVLGDICEAVIGRGVSRRRLCCSRRSLSSATGPSGCASRGGRCAIPRRCCRKWAQGRGWPTPVYREVERTGPHHDPQFRVAVDLPGLAPAEGIGGSKRAAEGRSVRDIRTRRRSPAVPMTDDPPDDARAGRDALGGFVALIGAPNVGKVDAGQRLWSAPRSRSSLRKVQTTRALIRRHRDRKQRPDHSGRHARDFFAERRLDRAMVSTAWSGAHDADLVCVLLDARAGSTRRPTRSSPRWQPFVTKEFWC